MPPSCANRLLRLWQIADSYNFFLNSSFLIYQKPEGKRALELRIIGTVLEWTIDKTKLLIPCSEFCGRLLVKSSSCG